MRRKRSVRCPHRAVTRPPCASLRLDCHLRFGHDNRVNRFGGHRATCRRRGPAQVTVAHRAVVC
ncbi:hypothetical protein RC1_3449 [Rhodospirillum centenum SW]|uniref:Uncharacterized protein n=1 Tax=Rhodospirillum centenum (strain ATCC 51521 / SW) TaxID=414684 RepID=B6IWY3_RHOCS|nr:hypothetical protein RC1_3449 [Rhodospirillum centenum SW]